jgi:hypothetical protein
LAAIGYICFMSFVDSGKAVILNSRQSLYPCGSDEWILSTARAVDDIARKNMILLTSVGSPAWEMGLYLAGKRKLPVILIVPRTVDTDAGQVMSYYRTEYRLDADRVRLIDIAIPPGRAGFDAFQNERDRRIVDLADVVYPVSIRPGGNLEKLLAASEVQGKAIDNSYEVPRPRDKTVHISSINLDTIDLGLDDVFRDYIIHWTRAVHQPWPGETHHDFYDAIVRSGDDYPRSALHTLMRILAEKRLRASPRHMRSGVTAVSFSSLSPSRAAALMRWRARYREMSFEPYGVAIKQSAAERIGIKKAVYGNKEMIVYLSADEKPYFQSLGTIGDWEKEREYRYLGDLDLNRFAGSDIRVITRLSSEIDKIKTVFDGEVFALVDK